MNVSKDMVVTIDYELKSSDGEILDSSDENGSLSFIQGSGFLIPGLERLLDGKKVGDAISETLAAADAFGEYDEALVFEATREDFEAGIELKEGLEFEAEINEHVRLCTITDIKGNVITVDANHPFSGEALSVRATVLGVRLATSEEIEHGHVHDGSESH